MSFYQFGIGGAFANPIGGNLATPNGPVELLTIQDCSVEFDQKLESLMGQNKGPDDVAASDQKVSFKSAFGRIDINIYNQLFWGDTVSTGGTTVIPIPGEAHTIPASTPFTIMVAPPNSGTWAKDGGVFFSATNQQLQRVAMSPTTGEYSVSGGTYTFAAADEGLGIYIYYSYTVSTGQTLKAFNHLQGFGPIFELYLAMPYQESNCLHLLQCRCTKMSAPMKRNGYLISAFEGEAYPLANSEWLEWYEADTY